MNISVFLESCEKELERLYNITQEENETTKFIFASGQYAAYRDLVEQLRDAIGVDKSPFLASLA